MAAAVGALQKIVRDYPLSIYADQAKKKLHDLEAEVPAADPAALARMKYEQENRTKTSTLHNATALPAAWAGDRHGGQDGDPGDESCPNNFFR